MTFQPPSRSAHPADAYHQAWQLLEERDPRGAIALLDPAIEAEPESTGLRTLRAWAYFQSAQLRRAEEELSTLVDECPTDLWARYALGPGAGAAVEVHRRAAAHAAGGGDVRRPRARGRPVARRASDGGEGRVVRRPDLTVRGSVRISAPSWVTSSVCSNCAERRLSRVLTVQPSSHMSHSWVPRLIIGSMVNVMPGSMTDVVHRRRVVVRHDQPGVERGADAVAGELADDAVAEPLRVGLDDPAEHVDVAARAGPP